MSVYAVLKAICARCGESERFDVMLACSHGTLIADGRETLPLPPRWRRARLIDGRFFEVPEGVRLPANEEEKHVDVCAEHHDMPVLPTAVIDGIMKQYFKNYVPPTSTDGRSAPGYLPTPPDGGRCVHDWNDAGQRVCKLCGFLPTSTDGGSST